MHKIYVFRIDRNDGSPWVARPFLPLGHVLVLRATPRSWDSWSGDYPAERLAVEDAVSDFDGSAVLVTGSSKASSFQMVPRKFAMMGDLLGQLHALPYDDSVNRPGGSSGEDPSREGTPRQDLLAALSFLDSVDTKVTGVDASDSNGSATRCARPTTVKDFQKPCSTEIFSTPLITRS